MQYKSYEKISKHINPLFTEGAVNLKGLTQRHNEHIVTSKYTLKGVFSSQLPCQWKRDSGV